MDEGAIIIPETEIGRIDFKHLLQIEMRTAEPLLFSSNFPRRARGLGRMKLRRPERR